MKNEFGFKIKVLDWGKEKNWPLKETNILVNTTSLGMTGQPELSSNLAGLNSSAIVTDLVYAPLETPLLRQGREMGCKVVDGLGMLIHQAVPGFEMWFGKKPNISQEIRDNLLK